MMDTRDGHHIEVCLYTLQPCHILTLTQGQTRTRTTITLRDAVPTLVVSMHCPTNITQRPTVRQAMATAQCPTANIPGPAVDTTEIRADIMAMAAAHKVV
jgi:hypothetical protein